MTESPETPSLADRLDRFRLAVMADGERSLIMNPPVSDEDRTAAAAQLRQLDRIKAAYEAVKDEHLASVRPFRADCGNAKCAHLIACLIDELDALEVPDADT